MTDMDQAEGRSGLRRRAATIMIAVGLTVTVVFGVAAGVFFWLAERGDDGSVALSTSQQDYEDAKNLAFVDEAATQEAAQAAVEIGELVFSYDYATVDSHAESIADRLTPEMQKQYDQTNEVTAEVSAQARTVVQAMVPPGGVAVRSLTADAAEVIFVLLVEGTNDDTPIPAAYMTMEMGLTKIDGRWIMSSLAAG